MVSNTTQITDTVYVQLVETSQSFKEAIIDPNNIIALSAVLISICGFIYSLYQGWLSREMNRLSNKPLIEVNIINHLLGEGEFSGHVHNGGLGVATITQLNFIHEDKIYDSFIDLIIEKLPKEYHSNFVKPVSSFTLLNTWLIPSQKEQNIFSLNTGTNASSLFMIALEKILKRITIEIEYNDIFDKKYTYSFKIGK